MPHGTKERPGYVPDAGQNMEKPAISPEERTSLENEVWASYGNLLDGMSNDAKEKAVRKLTEVVAEERLRTTPPQGMKSAGKAEEPSEWQTIDMSPEKQLAIMDPSKWVYWDTVVYNETTYVQFAGAFGSELAVTLRDLSSDAEKRKFELETIKNLFEQKVFHMYCNRYRDIRPDVLRRNSQELLDDLWEKILASANSMANS